MRLSECIYFLTTRLSRELRKVFDKKLDKFGLTSAMWCTLMVIIENPGVNQKDISDILCIETPTVTRILDNLEKRGYILRVSHEYDRRSFKVKLTKKGEELKEEISYYGECFMSWVKRDLSEEEKVIIKNLLNKLYESVKKESF